MKSVKDRLKDPSWPELVKKCHMAGVDLSAHHMGHSTLDGLQSYVVWAAVVTEVHLEHGGQVRPHRGHRLQHLPGGGHRPGGGRPRPRTGWAPRHCGHVSRVTCHVPSLLQDCGLASSSATTRWRARCWTTPRGITTCPRVSISPPRSARSSTTAATTPPASSAPRPRASRVSLPAARSSSRLGKMHSLFSGNNSFWTNLTFNWKFLKPLLFVTNIWNF